MATEADKQNIAVIGTIVGIGAFAMIAVSLAVTAMVRAEVTELEGDRSSTADLQTVRDLKTGQRSALSERAHWADKAKGVVAIPLERAMQLVAQDFRKNPRLATPSKPGTKGHADAGAPPADAGAKGRRKRSKAAADGANKRAPTGSGGSGNSPGSPTAPAQTAAPAAPAPAAPVPAAPAPAAPAPAAPTPSPPTP